MEYHFRLHEEVSPAVRRIALKQVNLAIHEAHDEAMDRHEAVHRIRKRCKKQRALLRLVRGSISEDTFDRENAFYRDLSRRLSSLRDAQALLEAFDRTVDRFQETVDTAAFHDIRSLLVQQRSDEAGQEGDLWELTKNVATELVTAGERISQWKLDADEFDAFEVGLKRTYRRARRGLGRAQLDSTTEVLHEWRKRVKYHWYHTRLLRRMSPRLLRPHRQMGAELGSLLGQDHDMAVLRERLLQAASSVDAGTLDKFLSLASKLQGELQDASTNLGRHLLAEEPSRLADRWRAYWQAARSKDRPADAPAKGV